jgi:hypothetical protein
MAIWEHPLGHKVSTGLDYGVLLPDCVPIYEEREAAVYCRYTPAEFRALPLEERAAVVAQYRLHQLVETHVSDAVNKATEQEMGKRRH